MEYSTTAKYFDGQSSVADQISLFITEQSNELCLQWASSSSIVWDIADLEIEQYGNYLEIRNKRFSGAVLQIDDEVFLKNFLEIMKRKNQIDLHHRILSIGFPKIVGIALAILGVIVLAYVYVLPPVAEKAAELLPESFDSYLGDTFMESFYIENTVDSAQTAYLNDFAAHIDFENTKTLHFLVIKSAEVNAFALPNGQIVVYTGILEKLQNSNELAAVLAHEAVHVNSRHSIKMLCRDLASYLLISLIFSDVNGIMAILADNAQELHALSYSRKFENESDEKGLNILMNNHINPTGMVQLFELLEKEEKIAIPKIISTHPPTNERKESMQEIIARSEYTVISNHTIDSIFSQLKQ
jgi:predicted Zn-dependent protease